MICQPTKKITQFCGQFKKYKMSKKEIKNICINSGGLLGSKVKNFIGLFETLKPRGISAKELLYIFSIFPEFCLQNRMNIIWQKLKLITDLSDMNATYLKNFIKRHPDIVMKSYASMEAKVTYLQRNLNRTLKLERSFPLILHYNYNQVIRPRGDILKDRLGVNNFDLREAFGHTDENVCKHFGIDPEELRQAQKKRNRKNNVESDKMWVQVPLKTQFLV